MDTKINIISASEHELEVSLTYEEIQSDIEKAYQEEKKKLEVPGFRKGKVPMQMIKRMYGDLIEHQASEKIANKKFWDIVDEQKLEPMGPPKMTDLNFEPGKMLSFKITYEVKPTLELKDYTGNEIKKIVWEVSEDQIEAELNYSLKTNSTLEDTDTIDDLKSIITVDLQKIDDQGNKVEGIRSDNINIDLTDERVAQQIKDKAVGKKVGESFNFSFHDHQEVEENGEKKMIHEDINYEAVVKNVKKVIYPELNDEFVKKITKDRYKTIEDWRSNIKTGLQNYFNKQSEDIVINSLISTVVNKNDFSPPHNYVHIVLDRMIQVEEEKAKREGAKRFDKHEAHNRLHERAEFSTKWQIILANLAVKENITVEESELKEIAEKESAETGISSEKLFKYYKDTNRLETLLEDKVIDFLLKNNNIKEIKSSELQESLKEKEGQ